MGLSTHAQHAEKIQAAVGSGQAAKSALVASWRRSAALHHLDPTQPKPPHRLTDTQLAQARERIEPLIRAAHASLDRLYQAVGGSGCCVLLADRNGVPVERRGAFADDETFNEWGLWTGAIWNEESEGTNGIGTCLVEGRALTIHRDQHFLSKNTLLTCTTAPIYDHVGNLAAALDVSSCRADMTEGFVQLVGIALGDAVRRIEAENFRQSYPDTRIIVAPAPDNAPGALLAVDKDDVIVGATRAARIAFNLSDDLLSKPVLASDLLGGETGFSNDLRDAERAILERALIRSNGNVTGAARILGLSRATLHRKLSRLGLRGVH